MSSFFALVGLGVKKGIAFWGWVWYNELCMWLVRNRYYSDYGLDFVFSSLSFELAARDVVLSILPSPAFSYLDSAHLSLSPLMPTQPQSVPPSKVSLKSGLGLSLANAGGSADFLAELRREGVAIFWDKDVRLARALEALGIRLLPNSADTLAACDDKELTYSRLVGSCVPLIRTISAPLVFDVNTQLDSTFLDYVEAQLGYPIVVKENHGSQGKQVYLAANRAQLDVLNQKLLHIPHIYQQFCGEFGTDIRVYIIGAQAVACVKRTNTTDFKSNIALGGDMELYPLDDRLRSLAAEVSARLNLEYGSVDFLCNISASNTTCDTTKSGGTVEQNDSTHAKLANITSPTENKDHAKEAHVEEAHVSEGNLSEGNLNENPAKEAHVSEGYLNENPAKEAHVREGNLERDYVFVEANSNAYFKGIESLGIPIARMLAEHILSMAKDHI